MLYRNADIEESVSPRGVLGHPAVAIALAREQGGAFRRHARAGPGDALWLLHASPVWAQKGDTLRADFGPLGSLSVQFV